MPLAVTPLYAALAGALGLALSVRVVRLRWRVGAGSGDGGDKTLARAIRAHGNFSEYAPFGLVLMLAVELAGASVWLLHAIGLCLVLGRVLHAAAFSLGWQPLPLRISAMMLTYASLALASLAAAALASL